jgi:LacI family transcriptional regulator
MTDTSPEHPTTVPTLADVARLAQVSTATVSRCLNTPDQVVAKTRERVLQAIETLGYTPNFGARALAARQTRTVGAIIPTMENAIFARGIQAFQEELRENGFTLLVASSSYRADVEEEQIRTLTARGADALLLIGHNRNPEIYAFLRRRNVPALVAWVYQPGAEQASIGFDNRKAMAEMARAALTMGHRRIGYISAEISTNDRASERVEGVRMAMTEFGLDPDRLDLIETPYSIENGGTALQTLLSRAQKPTLVICGNDVLAAGALMRAKQLGLSVPGDLSITGFDDIEIARLTDPALTTVHVPHREMGRRAARQLIGMLDGTLAPSVTELDTYLCLRATLAPPPISASAEA